MPDTLTAANVEVFVKSFPEFVRCADGAYRHAGFQATALYTREEAIAIIARSAKPESLAWRTIEW